MRGTQSQKTEPQPAKCPFVQINICGRLLEATRLVACTSLPHSIRVSSYHPSISSLDDDLAVLGFLYKQKPKVNNNTLGGQMGSSEALQAAKVYRHLLKAVKKHIGTEEHKIHFTDFIKQEFLKSRQRFDPSFIQQKVKLAHDFTFLLNCVHHHKDLLFSYNIAVDRSDEMKKVLGKSAASVGLQLPDVYKP